MIFIFRDIVWECSKVAGHLSWHLLSSSFCNYVWTLTVGLDLISQVSRNPARWKGSSETDIGCGYPLTAAPVHSGSYSHVQITSDESIGQQIASRHFFVEPSASGIPEFRPAYFLSWGCWTERGIQYWKIPSNVHVMQYFKIERLKDRTILKDRIIPSKVHVMQF